MLLVALRATPSIAWGQAWPTKPVKIVAPFAAGGNVDVTARIVAEQPPRLLGQPVIVQNKTGARSMIGAEAVIIAESFQPLVLLVTPAIHAKDFASFLALARREPGKLTMGTAGAGSFTHLAGLLLEQRAGVRFEAVHYRGTGPGLADLMAGQISFRFEPIATALPLLGDGRLRALAVTSLERAAVLPDVPTVAQAGVANYEAINLLGLIAPAATLAPVIDQLSKAMKQVLEDPTVIKRFADLGTEARFTSPSAFFEIMHLQAETWISVIRAANIKLE